MQPNWDYAIYFVHGLFWAGFGVTRIILERRGVAPAQTVALSARQSHSAPYSRALVAFHALAFGMLYYGIAIAVVPNRVPVGLPGQRVLGTVIILSGSALTAAALAVFRSWRFRAKVETGHELATGGPFRYVRHPIYLGLNLFALGNAVWIPTVPLWLAVLLMVVGSDLRARAEERLLVRTFGAAYETYRARTARFIPKVY